MTGSNRAKGRKKKTCSNSPGCSVFYRRFPFSLTLQIFNKTMWNTCQRYQQPLRRFVLSNQVKAVAHKRAKSILVNKCASIHSSTKINNNKDSTLASWHVELIWHTNLPLTDANSVYTVRPTGFWMDKILDHESKKTVTNSTSKPRKLIDRTVSFVEWIEIKVFMV